jgi:hypothetical protein
MRVLRSQDFATGILYIVIGAAAYVIGSDYSMGTSLRPGSGVLPRILACCLMASGAALCVKAWFEEGTPISPWAWRPLVMVTLATIAFSLLIDRVGLVATMLVSMTLAALGTPETRWKEFAIFMVLMLVFGVGLFIWGLKMGIKVMPWS